jgi:hypothetical protein
MIKNILYNFYVEIPLLPPMDWRCAATKLPPLLPLPSHCRAAATAAAAAVLQLPPKMQLLLPPLWQGKPQCYRLQTLAILMAMGIRWCDAEHIARCSASVASCKATRCCHRASAHTVLPRRPPWSTFSNKTKKH